MRIHTVLFLVAIYVVIYHQFLLCKIFNELVGGFKYCQKSPDLAVA